MKDVLFQYLITLYNDVPSVVYEGLFVVLCIGTVFIILLKIWGRPICGVKPTSILRGVARLLLVEFVVLLYCSTVICRKETEEIIGHNFTPFWSYLAIHQGHNDLLVENVMNAIVFMPLGLLLGCAIHLVKWWNVLIIGLTISLTIELLQFFMGRGFAEFDDVFHNTLGCMIGYGTFLMIKKFF